MSEAKRRTKRRKFLRNSIARGAGLALGLGAATAPVAARQVGANELVRIGCIGVGNRGTQLLQGFLRVNDAKVVALCDVYEPYLQRDYTKVSNRLIEGLGGRVPKMTESLGENVARYRDFRRLLDRKDIDAVVIATPDHWHAIQTINACDAGKDVYVEKPLTITINEGRRIVEAAKRNRRVVQVGLHRRSSRVYRRLPELIQRGEIGKVTLARAYRISNMHPKGIGKATDAEPPPGLDWDMWLGPRPWRPYRENLALYKFRWWKNYSSQVANWGVHYFDAIRWMLAERAPVSISAHGGKFALGDDRTIPDTMEVIFEFAAGRLLVFGQYEASGGQAMESGEIELRGTTGNLYCWGSGYKIVGSAGGQFQEPAPRRKGTDVAGEREDATLNHIRNFLDCVGSRRSPNCDAETGHRSTTFALLANIALETRSRIEWDPTRERITNDDAANRLLHYEYRKPWTLG